MREVFFHQFRQKQGLIRFRPPPLAPNLERPIRWLGPTPSATRFEVAKAQATSSGSSTTPGDCRWLATYSSWMVGRSQSASRALDIQSTLTVKLLQTKLPIAF